MSQELEVCPRDDQEDISRFLPLIAAIKQPFTLKGKDYSRWLFLETTCRALEQCGSRRQLTPVHSGLFGIYQVRVDKLAWKVKRDGKKIILYTDPLRENFCVFRKGVNYPDYCEEEFEFSFRAIIKNGEVTKLSLEPEWSKDN